MWAAPDAAMPSQPPGSRQPTAWRKDLSAEQVIEAVLRCRGPARVQDETSSDVGGGCASDWAPKPALAPQSPLARGGGRYGRDDVLSYYRPYVGLQQWEALTSELKKEIVPTKRSVMKDYILARETAQTDLEVDGDASGVASGTASRSGTRTSTRVGRDSVSGPSSRLGSQRASDGGPLLPPVFLGATPASAGASGDASGFSGKRCAQGQSQSSGARSPRCRSDNTVSGAGTAVSTREGAGADVGEEATQEVAARIGAATEAATPRFVCAARVAAGPATDACPGALVVRTVHPARGPAAPGPVVSGHAGKVVDKDRGAYALKELRPAREKNTDSKRKLEELLKLPKAQINAAQQHPSRAFQVVPSQNLRVA